MGNIEYNKLVGFNIKRIRTEKKMSQIQLGALCNMEDTAISRIEAGRTNPTINTIHAISLALEVSIKDLLKED